MFSVIQEEETNLYSEVRKKTHLSEFEGINSDSSDDDWLL